MKSFQSSPDLAKLMLFSLQPEPEVTRATLGRVRCRSLAAGIANLINADEPSLEATVEGAIVTVRERSLPEHRHLAATMRFTIEDITDAGEA